MKNYLIAIAALFVLAAVAPQASAAKLSRDERYEKREAHYAKAQTKRDARAASRTEVAEKRAKRVADKARAQADKSDARKAAGAQKREARADKKNAGLVPGQNAYWLVTMVTSEGTVRFRLYDDTPLHRDNMVRLVKSGFYNDLLFHRVIENFMIQAGDPSSRERSMVRLYGDDAPGMATLPAEIVPSHYHRRGVVAAARLGDAQNPERRSSASQFYIVTGRMLDDAGVEKINGTLTDRGDQPLSPERERTYRSEGGAPHLDGAYTVFGEVVDGMSVVDKISKVPRDSHDRPREDVYIRSMTVELLPDGKHKK